MASYDNRDMDFIMIDVWFLFAYSWNILFCYVVTDEVFGIISANVYNRLFSIFTLKFKQILRGQFFVRYFKQKRRGRVYTRHEGSVNLVTMMM